MRRLGSTLLLRRFRYIVRFSDERYNLLSADKQIITELVIKVNRHKQFVLPSARVLSPFQAIKSDKRRAVGYDGVAQVY